MNLQGDLRLAGKEDQLRSVPTEQSDLSSVRPAYAVLDNFILRIIECMRCRTGKSSLKEYMDERTEDLDMKEKNVKEKTREKENGLTTKIFIALIAGAILESFSVTWFLTAASKRCDRRRNLCM